MEEMKNIPLNNRGNLLKIRDIKLHSRDLIPVLLLQFIKTFLTTTKSYQFGHALREHFLCKREADARGGADDEDLVIIRYDFRGQISRYLQFYMGKTSLQDLKTRCRS